MRILWQRDWPRPLLIFILFRLSSCQLRHISPFELTVNSGAIRGERVVGRFFGALRNDYCFLQKDTSLPDHKRRRLHCLQGYSLCNASCRLPPFSGTQPLQMPKEPAKWRGVMNATQFSALCVQRMDSLATDPERHTAHFSEDCLYLNVFSPTPVSSFPFSQVLFYWNRYSYYVISYIEVDEMTFVRQIADLDFLEFFEICLWAVVVVNM
ncbi:hypothetical protein ANCDUO_00112 [Ancylostoma duodenale]|uniref:Carboxylesterase type B domain-containing protein n=1 Tax=Ancylostoma duodenale TaxID=51022 RepID=A0A0C2DHV2_9BILA|nr:hypothetical protein ANCDUO_00112 [Ancylostoma duodenale]